MLFSFIYLPIPDSGVLKICTMTSKTIGSRAAKVCGCSSFTLKMVSIQLKILIPAISFLSLISSDERT